jgi:hypothetical protein
MAISEPRSVDRYGQDHGARDPEGEHLEHRHPEILWMQSRAMKKKSFIIRMTVKDRSLRTWQLLARRECSG